MYNIFIYFLEPIITNKSVIARIHQRNDNNNKYWSYLLILHYVIFFGLQNDKSRQFLNAYTHIFFFQFFCIYFYLFICLFSYRKYILYG